MAGTGRGVGRLLRLPKHVVCRGLQWLKRPITKQLVPVWCLGQWHSWSKELFDRDLILQYAMWRKGPILWFKSISSPCSFQSNVMVWQINMSLTQEVFNIPHSGGVMTAELTTAYQQETLCEIQLTQFGLESRTCSICIPSFMVCSDSLLRMVLKTSKKAGSWVVCQHKARVGKISSVDMPWLHMQHGHAWTRLGNRHYFLASIPCSELFFDTQSFARSKVHILHKML